MALKIIVGGDNAGYGYKEELKALLEADDPEHPEFAKAHKFKVKRLTDTPAGESAPTFSPKGDRIAFLRGGKLWAMNPDGTDQKVLAGDAQVFDYDGWIVPAGLDEARMNRVMHFLRFSSDTQRLADQAKYIAYGPARVSSQPLVSTHADLGIEMAPYMPTNPDNMKNFLVNNIEWWADHQDEVEATFQNWLAQ